jgi:hypothetical protein
MAARYRYCRDPVFVGALMLYILNRFLFKPLAHGHTVFFQYWGNDLLFIPLCLPPWLYINRLVGLRPSQGFPTRIEIAVHTVIWSFFCYWLAPVVIRGPFAWKAVDPWDPVACIVGSLIAEFCWGRSRHRAACRLHQDSLARRER